VKVNLHVVVMLIRIMFYLLLINLMHVFVLLLMVSFLHYVGGGDEIASDETHRLLFQLGNVGDVRDDLYGNTFVSDITSNVILRIKGQRE
jgi:hypothetical protein